LGGFALRARIGHSKVLKVLVYGAAVALLALCPTAASAGKFKVLYSFCITDCHDGAQPSAPSWPTRRETFSAQPSIPPSS